MLFENVVLSLLEDDINNIVWTAVYTIIFYRQKLYMNFDNVNGPLKNVDGLW